MTNYEIDREIKEYSKLISSNWENEKLPIQDKHSITYWMISELVNYILKENDK